MHGVHAKGFVASVFRGFEGDAIQGHPELCRAVQQIEQGVNLRQLAYIPQRLVMMQRHDAMALRVTAYLGGLGWFTASGAHVVAPGAGIVLVDGDEFAQGSDNAFAIFLGHDIRNMQVTLFEERRSISWCERQHDYFRCVAKKAWMRATIAGTCCTVISRGSINTMPSSIW